VNRRRLLSGLAAAALATSLALAFLPVAAPSLSAGLDPYARPLQTLIGVGAPAVVLGLLAFVRARRGREAAAPPPPTWTPEPDRERDPRRDRRPDGPGPRRESGGSPGSVPGGRFDDRLAEAADADAPRRARERAREEVVGDLRGAAVRVYRRVERCDRERAREAVRRGAWTDDPWAASLVGGEDAPPVPWGEWLRTVLAPGSTVERQVERTLDAIDRLEDEA